MKKTSKNAFQTIRKEYLSSGISRKSLLSDPVEQFGRWFDEALTSGCTEPNSMALATANAQGMPSLRMVLLKGFDRDGFVFFSNYESRKGRELAENPRGALLFYWPELHRQVRLEGGIERLSAAASQAYFHTRPFLSQIGALASRQSERIESREMLERRFMELEEKYRGQTVPMPDVWGGYLLQPVRFEFWQGRENRLHDRVAYILQDRRWQKERLSP